MRPTAEDLAFRNNPVLPEVLLPALTKLSENSANTGFSVIDNPMFPTCRAEAIRGQVDVTQLENNTISGNLATCP